MAEGSSKSRRLDRDASFEVDMTKAHIARTYDYMLGGTDNFEVDRRAAEAAFADFPGGVEGAKADARANRAFLKRVVTHMARDCGVRQFLDIGTGIPTDNTHAAVFEVAPDATVVYVDNDPIVLAHAHRLLAAASTGGVDYVFGDVRAPEPLLRRVGETLDLAQPVGLVLVGLMHAIPDSEGAHEIVRHLVDAVCPGSYLALSQLVLLDGDSWASTAHSVFDRPEVSRLAAAFRTEAEVVRFFDGTELVEPGVVELGEWRNPDPAPQDRGARGRCGLGRKP